MEFSEAKRLTLLTYLLKGKFPVGNWHSRVSTEMDAYAAKWLNGEEALLGTSAFFLSVN